MLAQYYVKVRDRLRYGVHRLRHGGKALSHFEFIGKQFDRRYGVETTAGVPVAGLRTESASKGLANSYAPSNPLVLLSLREAAGIKPGAFTFVDLGCGKGRMLILAAEAGFGRVVGVEFCADLTARARQNVTAYRGGGAGDGAVEVLHMDAAEYEFPEEPAVIFFYNSFRGEVLRRVLENLDRSLARRPRETYFIWNGPEYYPEMGALFEGCAGLKPLVRDRLFTIYKH